MTIPSRPSLLTSGGASVGDLDFDWLQLVPCRYLQSGARYGWPSGLDKCRLRLNRGNLTILYQKDFVVSRLLLSCRVFHRNHPGDGSTRTTPEIICSMPARCSPVRCEAGSVMNPSGEQNQPGYIKSSGTWKVRSFDSARVGNQSFGDSATAIVTLEMTHCLN